MRIIRQEIPLFAVPDFRNLGVVLRILMSALLLIFILPFFKGNISETNYWQSIMNYSIWAIPAVLASIAILSLFNRIIHSLSFSPIYVLIVVLTVFLCCEYWFSSYYEATTQSYIVISVYTLLLMHYQAVLQKAFSPALAQAQLDALTARIRPHFLFNSLNAAISLIRTRPTDAENVLENLADLFRAQLKSDSRESTLGREIELAKGYIDIEQIRMGQERLQINWQINAPENAVVPHLLLQPLLENAVYHGIEPSSQLGVISVEIVKKNAWIYIRIDNPIPTNKEDEHRTGNHMALKNLSERLFLMYDRDASLLSSMPDDKTYRVDITLPYHPYKLSD